MAITGPWITPRIYAAGYNFTGDSNLATLEYSAESLDSSAFGHATRRNMAGIRSIALNVAGFANLADNEQEEQTHGNLALASVPASLFPTNTPAVGDVAQFFQALEASYQLGGPYGELLKFAFVAAAGQSGHPLVRGYVLETGATARTASGNGSAVNAGAVGAAQYLYGVLHAVTVSAADTLDVIIQSDDAEGFGTPTTRAAFTQVTAIGGQYGFVAGSRIAGAITDTWWRASWTIGGVSPSFNFAVAMGIAGA